MNKLRNIFSKSLDDELYQLHKELAKYRGCPTCKHCIHVVNYPSYFTGEECECNIGLQCDTVLFTVTDCEKWEDKYMLDDWKWIQIDDYEYRLKDASNQLIAYLVEDSSHRWQCCLYNDDWNMKFFSSFDGLENTQEVIWQATIWIYNTCNQIANSFHHIRDHLPSLHKLHEDYEKSKEIKK